MIHYNAINYTVMHCLTHIPSTLFNSNALNFTAMSIVWLNYNNALFFSIRKHVNFFSEPLPPSIIWQYDDIRQHCHNKLAANFTLKSIELWWRYRPGAKVTLSQVNTDQGSIIDWIRWSKPTTEAGLKMCAEILNHMVAFQEPPPTCIVLNAVLYCTIFPAP